MGKNAHSRKLSMVIRFAVFAVIASVFIMPSASAQSFGGNVKEVYFPFNIYNRTIDPATLDANAAYLKQTPDAKMWIQGYADPRGDIVYNLVLSYRRAQWVKAQFVKRGIDASRIEFATGWGKLYQTCELKDDRCFQQNRRVDVVSPDSMMYHGGQ
ncbi:MAG TPA: OmpA family protein [Bryobacteraceae bacterium]|nr:OmpA family protein [Bryobacteraceae bacterium]